MAGKFKKHIGKIFVFALNLLLMSLAVFLIKQKEDLKNVNQSQNDLKNQNSSLPDENATLKNDLESLRGVLKNLEEKILVRENVTGNNSSSIGSTVPTQSSPTITLPYSNNSSSATSSKNTKSTTPPSNSKTKTS